MGNFEMLPHCKGGLCVTTVSFITLDSLRHRCVAIFQWKVAGLLSKDFWNNMQTSFLSLLPLKVAIFQDCQSSTFLGFLPERRLKLEWRDGLAVYSTCYSFRWPGSRSYHLHGSSPPSLMSVLGDQMIFSGLWGSDHAWYTDAHAGKNVHMHKIKMNFLKGLNCRTFYDFRCLTHCCFLIFFLVAVFWKFLFCSLFSCWLLTDIIF